METIEPAAPGAPRRVHRSSTNRWMAGVCGGLADYFRVDATLVRLLFVLLTICGGIGIPMYVLAWLIIPQEGELDSIGERMLGRTNQTVTAPPNGN